MAPIQVLDALRGGGGPGTGKQSRKTIPKNNGFIQKEFLTMCTHRSTMFSQNHGVT